MIKKLFTLFTLALLVTPLTWGKDFYLTGTFNDWAMADGAYKFTESAGDGYTIYTLTVTNLGACNFKISDGSQKYGYGDDVTNSTISRNSGQLSTRPWENGRDFVLKSGGKTTFTFKYDNGWPYQLEVTRDIQYYLLYNDNAINNNEWNNVEVVAMEKTSTNEWTISRTFPAETTADSKIQFAFNDEFGSWYGGNGWWIRDEQHSGEDWEHLDGQELAIGPNGNFVMTVPGDFVLKANSDFNKLLVMPTLATIEKNQRQGQTYLIANDLQVVAASTVDNHTVAFARDLTGTTVTCPSGKVDYMTAVAKDHTGDWIQNNWVMLDFNGVSQVPSGLLNGTIAGGSLKGVYADNNNYTINVDPNATLSVTPGTEDSKYVPNVYCPANFGPNTDGVQKGYPVENGMSVGESANVDYWFLTPKPMEVFELSGALYYNSNDFDEGFYMEQRKQENNKWFNPAGLKGGIGFNTDYNSGTPGLVVGQSYRFLTVAMKSGSKSEPSYGEPLRDYTYSLQPEPDQTLNQNYEAAALNLGNGSSIVTGVNDVKTGSDVVSVTYCDLAGRMSQKPFAGVNIIVTRYSDGTVKTTKAIK